MCGITGVLSFNSEPVSSEILKKMTDAIRHRGPDGEGVYLNHPIAFGHRRLAIIDLSSAGKQPMISADGRFVISYNGEIYNFEELKTELKKKGYSFQSRTDSEVLLNAFAEWGVDSLNRLNGMFAFAIWDNKTQELTLGRDRYGVKPVYYALNDSGFIFGSEIKAILAYPSFKAEMDREALLEYFTFQNFFTDRTLFKGVRILPAGCYLKISSKKKNPEITQYWDFNFSEPKTKISEKEYLEEFDRLFRQAVQRQLMSDVGLGSYLSGGLDSGSITALAAVQMPFMKTFTVGFDMNSISGVELAYDEREKAEFMSYLFKTEHYEMVLKAGDMERVLPKMTWHLEEPRVGQSYPNFYAAQLASKFTKVVLSGAGGDELFAGYPWRYYRAVTNDDFEHYIDKYYHFWHRLIPNTSIQKVFKTIWKDVSHVWTRDIFRDVFKHHAADLPRPEDYINHSLYFEAKTFLHGLLIVEDKLSMAHGLESRVPFLDNDLVDFTMKLPVKMKLGKLNEVVRINENEPGSKTAKYFEKTRDGKLLLRKAMQKYVPQEVSRRVKQGFSAPDASWFRGESIDYVRSLIFDNNARIYEFLDREPVQALVTEHLEGRENRRLLIWSLLSVEHWCRTFLK